MARASARSDISTASMTKSFGVRKRSCSEIASEYGSSPVLHGMLRTRTVLPGLRPAVRSAMNAASRSKSARPPRKNHVSDTARSAASASRSAASVISRAAYTAASVSPRRCMRTSTARSSTFGPSAEGSRPSRSRTTVSIAPTITARTPLRSTRPTRLPLAPASSRDRAAEEFLPRRPAPAPGSAAPRGRGSAAR